MSVSLRPEFPRAPRHKDYPIKDVMAESDRVIANGGTVYQKFTCAGCGARLTMSEPNTFYATGTCEHCPTVTHITKCNFTAIFSIPQKDREP